MKKDVTNVMVQEHKLILRMVSLVERNSDLTEQGLFSDWQFFLDAVDFIRHYADRFHHAKEEDTLFTALVANGMPEKSSPVAAMHMAHDQGRAFVRGMEEAATRALAGETGQEAEIIRNARGYAALLRDHIDKEDNILYPLAERTLPEHVRPAMLKAYGEAEASVPSDFTHRYRRMVERYESRETGARP
ncbi:MAG: hemerythrin domain-containing protein [bacterium]|nr:MAG: hemerythrin domain-containing protein [bacterium]